MSRPVLGARVRRGCKLLADALQGDAAVWFHPLMANLVSDQRGDIEKALGFMRAVGEWTPPPRKAKAKTEGASSDQVAAAPEQAAPAAVGGA